MKQLYRYLLSAILPIVLLGQAACQSLPEPPSDLQGGELRSWLKDNWYDGHFNRMGYDDAREAMYSYVDVAEDGRVYCVYTGFSEPAELTTYLNPINAEHTVPQSFFDSDEPMKSDIHHLFPTHGNVNSSRGNIDFGEIDDNVTDKWFIGGKVEDGTSLTILTSIPAENIDAYTEIDNSDYIEVKEANKGNTARAVFYFYTVYPTQAGSIEELADLETLYEWHVSDPVDEAERIRNDRAEERQGNRNPYIDYPEIAAKAWEVEGVCLEPAESAQNPIVANVTGEGASISWNNGNGDGRIVLIKEGEGFTEPEHPRNGNAYGSNSTFGQGAALGNAFVVYEGDGDEVEIEGLALETGYSVKIVEYACDPIVYEAEGQVFNFTTGTTTGLSENLEQAGIRVANTSQSRGVQVFWEGTSTFNYRLINTLGQTVVSGTANPEQLVELPDSFSGIGLLHLSNREGHWVKRIWRN